MFKYKFSSLQMMRFVTVMTTGRLILFSENIALEYEGLKKQVNET
jgi:hypothetical protein